MVADELNIVYERVERAATRAGRSPEQVTLVAVSKGQPVGAILQAYEAGHRDFGENRAAELAEKAPQLPQDIRWHFIGTLQTRQVKLARPHTTLLHSLDRVRLINAWSRDGEAPPVLLQVNVAGEEQKHGVTKHGAAELLVETEAAGLQCRGLMTIAPLVADPDENRKWFAQLRELRDEMSEEFPGLCDLSMGMTDDFEGAIEEGATIIRVGRAIFGTRTGTSD